MDTTFKSVSHITTNGKPGQNGLAYIKPVDLQVAEPNTELTADQERLLEQVRVNFPKRGPDFVRKVTEDYATGDTQPEQPAIDRFQLHSATEARGLVEPTEWRVDGLIEAGGLYIFAGDAGSAKTFLLLDLAVAYANQERQWGDYWLSNHRAALLVDEESGDKRLRRRLNYAQNAHNVVGELPLYYITQAAIDIRNPEDIGALRGKILQVGAGLVIIDALMDIIPGGDENSVKDMIPALLALSRLAKETNAAILLIHHTNRAGDYRGSSSIKGGVDGLFLVKKEQNSNVVEIEAVKTRDIKDAHITMVGHWENRPGTEELERVYFTAADEKKLKPVHLSKSERYALTYLGDHPNSLLTDVMNHAATCTPGAAKRAVYSLADRKFAERTDAGGIGDKAVYSLTENGREIWATL